MAELATWLLILCTTTSCSGPEGRVTTALVTEQQCSTVLTRLNKYVKLSYCVGPNGEYHDKPWVMEPKRGSVRF